MGDQSLQSVGADDLIPYRRGLPIGAVLKGALSRFLPGSLVGTGTLTLIFDLSARGGDGATAGVVLGLGVAMTLGYGTTLLGMRRWLFPDARPDGPRSFLAGVLAPFAVFVALVAGVGLSYLPILSVGMGIACAVGLYFAWLTPTPREMRGPAFFEEINDADNSGRAS